MKCELGSTCLLSQNVVNKEEAGTSLRPRCCLVSMVQQLERWDSHCIEEEATFSEIVRVESQDVITTKKNDIFLKPNLWSTEEQITVALFSSLRQEEKISSKCPPKNHLHRLHCQREGHSLKPINKVPVGSQNVISDKLELLAALPLWVSKALLCPVLLWVTSVLVTLILTNYGVCWHPETATPAGGHFCAICCPPCSGLFPWRWQQMPFAWHQQTVGLKERLALWGIDDYLLRGLTVDWLLGIVWQSK